jgi:hypothetical protein
LNPLPLPAGCNEDATALAHRQCVLPTAGASFHGSSGSGGGNGKWKAKQKQKKTTSSSEKKVLEVSSAHSNNSPPPLLPSLQLEGSSEGNGLLAKMVLPK